jgi:outer membrane autotransporter protein
MNKNRKFSSSHTTLRQRPATRAIRAALLASASLIALGTAPAAFAQTCTDTAPNEVTCSGPFTDSVENSIPPGSAMPDLTLILDDTTTVNPATGVTGLTADWGGTVTVMSSADIATTGADGIYQYGDTAAILSSYGDISTAVLANDDNAIDIGAMGDVDVTIGGDVLAYNAGAIDVLALSADSVAGNTYVLIDGNGYVGAQAYDGDAIAVGAFADLDTTIDNSGSILAQSTYGDAVGAVEISTLGYATLDNSGSIGAYGYYTAEGASINAFGGDALVDNGGDVTATADGGLDTVAMGIGAYGGIVTLQQGGTVTASAYGVDSAYATGVGLAARTEAYAYNYGTIAAYADGATGFAHALEINAGDYAYAYNGGDLIAYGSGGAYATGLFAKIGTAGDVDIVNGGYIGAGADYGRAVGLYAYTTAGDISVTNYGDIYAYGASVPGIAVAACANGGTSVIDNQGTIGGDIAISSCGTGTARIYNSGEIDGPIVTGAGDDYFYNSGTFNATGTTGFGAGDDTIVNTGTINMSDATITLGDPGVAGNNFFNHGTVAADGYNVIDMGAGNPNPFNNYGHLDLQDGDTDDSLVIFGDFAGGGQLDLDASGATGVADTLYIAGNVDAYSTTTINVDMIDLSNPVAIDGIALVGVSGDSTADNFDLGTVNFDRDNSFVDLGFTLNADIDATNLTPDVFSLGVAVTGLTDVGTIATTVAPSVHSLFATQIGTWRQRMGVIDNYNKGAISLWARVFYNRGDFSPGHDSDQFDDNGNFDYESFNSGGEAGVDFAVTDQLSLGLLAAKSRAKNTLDPGIASSKVEADTWGLYATWLTENFYVDASYRWMSFDTTLESSAGVMEGSGDAEAFNVEAGYGFKMGNGFVIEPQLQYTDTNITDIDAFVTSNGMTFQADGGHSSRARAGVSFRKAFGDADTSWLFTPYLTLSLVDEFDGDHGYVINDTLFGRTNTEGTSGMVELGATARHEGWAIYGGVTWQDGGALNDYLGGHLGVRYTFGGRAPAPAPVVVPPPAKTCADMDDDADGVNNCDDKCLGSTAGQAVGPDGCPVPPPEPVVEPKPYRN